MKTLAILLLLFCSEFLFAQGEGEKKKIFPTAAAGIQYAGSLGWLSAGYYRQSANEKFELGLLYGYTPEVFGGEVHSVTLKFIYEPFRINMGTNIQYEPLQLGAFITQNFADNLYLSWPDQYKPGYYWWMPSTRVHIFLGMQASYLLNAATVKKISFYFEANTNDRYYSSLVANNNRHSIELDDIFFFGIGAKVYFQ